jgi:hypothetical protein
MPSNLRLYKRALLAFTIVLMGLPALAQEGTATLNGRITDPGGLAVVAAKVEAVNIATNVTYSAETNEVGLYGLPTLPPGTYRVVVSKEGFAQIVKPGVELQVADIIALNFSLQIGSVTQSVTVEGGTSQVETTSSELGGVVNDQEMADLPLNGRNYIDLSLMQAGISQNRNQSTLGGMSGTVFSSNGAPTVSNNYLLDGTSMVNQSGWSTASMAGTTLGVDGIKEFKVVTNAFSADYGMTMGSQMVMVSKGGTNQFHGDGYDYLRNSALDARNYFDAARIPEFQKNNYGGSFGGPIKKDKTFFYVVYEGLKQNLGVTALDVVPAAGCHGAAGDVITNTECPQLGTTPSATIVNSQVAALLSLYPNPGPSATNIANNTFTFPASTQADVNFGQIRIDQNFSASDTLFGRYTTDASNINSANNGGSTATGGVAFPQFRGLAYNRDQFLTLSENHILSPAILNTVRVAFSRTNFGSASDYTTDLSGIPSFTPGEPFGTLGIGGLSSIGVSVLTGPPSVVHVQNIYSFADDVYLNRGKHGIKFGTLINRYNQGMIPPVYAAGSVSYGSLASFLKGVPSSVILLAPGFDVNRDFIYNTLGFYVQDDWHFTPRLTFNLGLRYEFMTTPWELNGKEYALRNIALDPAPTHGPVMRNKSYLNFSPRLGFAWDIFGNGKMAVRGAFGVYYDVANLGNALSLQASQEPPLAYVSRINNQTAQLVYTFPVTLAVAAPSAHSIAGVDYNANQPRVQQYNLSVERELPGHLALSVAYVGSRGIHLWTAKEANTTIPTAVVNGVDYWSDQTATCASVVPSCRLNPNFTSYLDTQTAGSSWFNSLQVVVNKQLGKGLEFQAAYTYAHALDWTSGELAGSDCTGSGMDEGVDPQHPRTDRGPACFDIRHNLRFNLIYHLPNIKSNGIAAKFVNGWWVGNIVSVQGGYPFSAVESINRSNSAVLSTGADRVDLGTATVAPGQVGPDGSINKTPDTFIPFDAKHLYTGNPNQWFNPLMFTLQPMVPCPGAANAGLTCGTLGDSQRGLLRGPGLGTWDASLVKDTPLPFLGEQGSLEFRAEFFNLLNRTNFSLPSGAAFTGSTGDIGAYSEAPISSAGRITSTTTTSRQGQLVLKIIF